jgi:cell division transport system ATP-binding protein
MILCQNVVKRYPGGQEALSQVSLRMDEGAMAYLTGHSGAGKSTLLKLISLIERPTRGRITVNGQHLNTLPRRKVPHFRRSIGIIFQDHHLLHDRTVFDNVALPLVILGYRSPEIARRVRAALDKVGLLHKERARPVTLSSGEQQRVGIARAVVHKPAVLLADEPTGNLDPDLSREIMNLFLQFNQVGVTTLIASHDLELITTLGKPILRLEAGRLVETGARPAPCAGAPA